MPRYAAGSPSCVEIRNELALQPRNLILEQELAPLEAFHLQFIDFEIHGEAGNDVIEIAGLDGQRPQALDVFEPIGFYVAFFVAPRVAPSFIYLGPTGGTPSGRLSE